MKRKKKEISLTCDVFYIKDNRKLNGELIVHFIIEILHSNDVYSQQLINGVYTIMLQLLESGCDFNTENNLQEIQFFYFFS